MSGSFGEFLLSTITSAGASAALVVALAWLLRSWWEERIKNSIKHEYDRDIEGYKSTLALIHGATSEGRKAAIDVRIKAFDNVWKSVLYIRNTTIAYTHYLDILTIDEYDEFIHRVEFRKLFASLEEHSIAKMFPPDEIEEARPYIGEVPWSLYVAYRSFRFRLLLLQVWAVRDVPESIHWYKDNIVRQILNATLDKDEIDAFDKCDIAKVAFITNAIEQKLVLALRNLLSGQEFGDEAVRQARRITSQLGPKWEHETKRR